MIDIVEQEDRSKLTTSQKKAIEDRVLSERATSKSRERLAKLFPENHEEFKLVFVDPCIGELVFERENIVPIKIQSDGKYFMIENKDTGRMLVTIDFDCDTIGLNFDGEFYY